MTGFLIFLVFTLRLHRKLKPVEPFKVRIPWPPLTTLLALLSTSLTPLMVSVISAAELSEENVSSLQSIAPHVHLTKLIYESNDTVGATVKYISPRHRKSSSKELLLFATTTGDLERVSLKDLQGEPTRSTINSIPLHVGSALKTQSQFNGILEVAPGDVILAMAGYSTSNVGFPLPKMVSCDFALIYDPAFSASKAAVNADIALQKDESDSKVYGESLATIALTDSGGYSVGQIALNEVLFAPRNRDELDEFLKLTGGRVVPRRYQGASAWFTIQLNPPSGIEHYLPQLRDITGDGTTLLSSGREGLALYAYALQMRLEGFQVAINPRFYTAGDAGCREDMGDDAFNGEKLSNSFDDPVFGLREAWAYLAMWDKDGGAADPIRVAFLDEGFDPNNDWRGYSDGLVHECDVATGATGSGEAIGPPTVGGSYFEDLNWHGTGVLSIASGMLNNGWGTVGTGGEVVLPMLYEFNQSAYANQISDTIKLAVDDGADIVNLSAGFPCRFLWILGPDNVCTAGARAAFLAKLGAKLLVFCSWPYTPAHTTIELKALCAALMSQPILTTAVVEVAFAGLLLYVETRGDMEDAVDYAKTNGVPVVSISGNTLDWDDLPKTLQGLVTEEELDNTDIDEWEIIPGVIPDVICAASVDDRDSTKYYANVDFYGDSVDIWAPIYSSFYAPSNDNVVIASPAQYDTGFSGTSAAAPYVTGVIADMMAVNPSLCPHKATSKSLIVDTISTILEKTTYTPGVADATSGRVVLPLSSDVTVSVDVATNMDVRDNLINPHAAILSAAAGVIPDAESLGLDVDNGHQTDGETRSVGFGDDVGDEPSAAVTLDSHDTPPYASISDEIHFIWPEPPSGVAITDVDCFRWVAPRTGDTSKKYRQKIHMLVPDYPKSLPWLSYWHGGRSTSTTGLLSYDFYTPWLTEASEFYFSLSTPQFTDTPYVLETDSYEEGTLPVADAFDTPPISNDTEATPADISAAATWTQLTGGFPAEWFEQEAWLLEASKLSLHSASDVDWYQFTAPAAPLLTACGEPCDPMLWIEVQPPDPNIQVAIYDPVTFNIIKRGRGSERLALLCNQFGGIALSKTPLLLKIQSSAGTIHEYNIVMRLSVPIDNLCCCWYKIVSANFETESPVHVDPKCGSTPIPRLVDWALGSRVLYKLDGQTRAMLVSQKVAGEFWVSAFLGHDTDFTGHDQQLRMDLFGIQNCYWIAGSMTKNGVKQVIYEPDTGPPPVAGYDVGDLDLYIQHLEPGSYCLVLSNYDDGDEVDLVFGATSVSDKSVTVENMHTGTGTPEVTIGPTVNGTSFTVDTKFVIPDR